MISYEFPILPIQELLTLQITGNNQMYISVGGAPDTEVVITKYKFICYKFI